MTPSIFIFGTSHPLQCGTDKYSENAVNNFRAYIREICSTEGISIIIEEMSKEGLDHYEAESTIASHVAKELQIEHLCVDLESQERAKLNISDGDLAMIAMNLSKTGSAGQIRDDLTNRLSSPIRERYWIARILSKNTWPVLFICGSDHVASAASIIGGLIERVIIKEYDYDPQN